MTHRHVFARIIRIAFIAIAATSFMFADEAPHKRPDPARFAKDIQKFTDDDAANPTAKGGIVFTGSSSIRLWGDLKKVLPDLPVMNRGFGGSTASDCIVYANEIVLRYEPKVLVFYEGGNDLHGNPKGKPPLAGLTPEEAFADATKFLTMVHEKLPKTRVIVNSVKIAPVRADEISKVEALNRLLEAWCGKNDWVTWVEATQYLYGSDRQPREELYRSDRLHLNDDGYAQWKKLLEPHLRKAWAEIGKQ